MYPISGGGEDESSLLHINISMKSVKDTTPTHNTQHRSPHNKINFSSFSDEMLKKKKKKTMGKQFLPISCYVITTLDSVRLNFKSLRPC